MAERIKQRHWGDLLVRAYYSGSDSQRLVVERADEWVLASPELVADWRGTDPSPYVHVDGDYVTFGTEGFGLGVVTYLIGQATGPQPGQPETPSVPLKRVR